MKWIRTIVVLYFIITFILFVYLIFLKDFSSNSQRIENFDLNYHETVKYSPASKASTKCGQNLVTIYVITPTYYRLVQKAELTRLVHTFKLVPCLHWILIEDSNVRTKLVRNLLEKSNLPYTHLNIQTPPEYKLGYKDKRWKKPRGVLQRNMGLKWLRSRIKNGDGSSGVVYFADDDNTYDLQLFEEMRSTKKVSVWPVGLVGKLRYESPTIRDGRVVDWLTFIKSNRTFATDMAGFAISMQLIMKNDVEFNIDSKRGMQENDFLTKFITVDELEPKADDCTKVLVWHTQSIEPSLKNEDLLRQKGQHGSNLNVEV